MGGGCRFIWGGQSSPPREEENPTEWTLTEVSPVGMPGENMVDTGNYTCKGPEARVVRKAPREESAGRKAGAE